MEIITSYIEQLKNNKTIILKIKVTPKMAKIEFKKQLEDGTLKLSIRSAPEKGKANEEIINFLAKEFSTKRNCIKILSGHTSRLKMIAIHLED